ncbi:MAG: PfkB family carbohydrate kinase, partial [Coriobacteriales bacterium]|nr:PfkB family carbohydrate kinase [Coriobacteriales bacterium]
ALEAILSALHKRFPNTCVVLTLGEKGSMCIDGDGTRATAAAHKVDAVDTTAAGDTFTGYFLAARLEGRSLDESPRVASVASGIAVTRRGAAPSIPNRDEVAAMPSQTNATI